MFCQQRFVNNGRGHRHPKKEVTSHASLRISVTLILIKYEILRIRSPKEQDAQLSQRDRAAGCGYVLKRMFTKFSEITQRNGHYAVQGHSRSPILVPIES